MLHLSLASVSTETTEQKNIQTGHCQSNTLHHRCIHIIREFKQTGQRQQRKRQNSNFAGESSSLYILCCHCTTTARKCLISRLVDDVNTRQQLSFSFTELRYSLLEFNFRKMCQRLKNGTRWNKGRPLVQFLAPTFSEFDPPLLSLIHI